MRLFLLFVNRDVRRHALPLLEAVAAILDALGGLLFRQHACSDEPLAIELAHTGAGVQ